MDDAAQVDATSVWDERYEKGGHVGTAPTIEGDPVDYTQHRFLYAHAIGKPTTGALDGWPIESFARRHLTDHRPARVLAIGSGMAFIEEHLLAHDMVGHITAYEMSPTACKAATARVADKPYADRLVMKSVDVLTEDLADASFDMVFVQAAIHHFFAIEEMFDLFHRVLKPGGLLWYDEYVGPDHHMYDRHVFALMDEINDCLAPGYRRDVVSNAGRVREKLPEPSLEFMLQHDPSEGVHASRILPLTYQYFDVLERQDYGGAIMRPFFTGILNNFDWDDPKDQTVARLVVLFEQVLTREGVIPSYHSMVLARRKDVIGTPMPEAAAARITYADWAGPDAVGDAPGRDESAAAAEGGIADRLWSLRVAAGRRAPHAARVAWRLGRAGLRIAKHRVGRGG
ncbi:MAG: methyltransferase domain-containing protein [Gluconacetobacter diazotrophicus]|nr:methyltransferase domain-containing protein [Gluconacetobacter diazotrophicus]